MVLQTAANGISKQNVFKEIKESSKKIKKELTTTKKEKMKILTRFDRQKSTVIKKVKDHRKKIDKLLDDLEKETLSELERASERGSGRLKEEIGLYENIISTLSAAAEMLVVVKGEPRNETRMFVGLKRTQQKIQEGETLLRYANHAFSVPPINYHPDDNILNWLSCIQCLGTFTHQRTIYSGKLIGKYDVSVKDDLKSCDMFGSVILPDGRLLLTDWDNKKVKRLDSSFQVVDNVILSGNPDDICLTYPEEAIVSMPMLKHIQFINLGNSMTLTRIIQTDEHCRGLCYHTGCIYVVCGGFKDEKSGRIVVYSYTGDIVRFIEKNRTGQHIFVCPIAITVRSDGKLLHVTDGRRGLITLTSENDVVSVVANKNIAWPCGICLDKDERILVCNGRTNNVIQVTGFNKFSSVLSSDDGLKRPHSLTYDPKTSRLVLTMNRSKFVYVYQLQDILLSQALEGAPLNVETTESNATDAKRSHGAKRDDQTVNGANDGHQGSLNDDTTHVEITHENKIDDSSAVRVDTAPTKLDTTLKNPGSSELQKIPEEGNKERNPDKKSTHTSITTDTRSPRWMTTGANGSKMRVSTLSSNPARIKTSSRESNMSDNSGGTTVNSTRNDRKFSTGSTTVNSSKGNRKYSAGSVRNQGIQNGRNTPKQT
ncbi:hypothetical protein ACF0H5_001447 [Mactra antiquata]